MSGEIKERFGLKGRTAIVTGASRGIGGAVALGLAAAGAGIVAVGRAAERLKPLERDIREFGREVHLFEADIRETKAVERLFEGIVSAGLCPDILINNAGTEEVAPSDQVSPALWDKIVDTNLKGAFFVAQHFARPLLTDNKPGSIINLGSLTSAVGVPTAVPYTASKSGILGMTRALSTEWSPRGIRVNALGPGYFRTELTETFYQDDAWQQRMLQKIPMGRFGNLDDLVGTCIFLASDASAYLSGQIIYVDGGYLASI